MFCDYISLSQVTEMHSVLYCSKSFSQSGKNVIMKRMKWKCLLDDISSASHNTKFQTNVIPGESYPNT